MSKKVLEFPSPRPWRLEGETIRDKDGGVVVSAINPANMPTRELIVRAVNERNTLRDLVYRLAHNIKHYHLTGGREYALIHEACKAIGRRMSDV